jgi:predicted Zn-dependent peptidase
MHRSVIRLLLCALCLSGLRLCRAEETPAPIVLPNGLRVVYRERYASPLVAIDLWIRAGAREERPEENGSAHFLEHTLFKGTTTRGPGDADIAIENLGATLNAATGPDFVHFYTTVASVHLEEALAVLADVVRSATLPEAEIERERGVILDELAQHDADPSAHLVDLLYANAFPTHPYRRSPGGDPNEIRVRRRETLLTFYRRVYTPERSTLALVGDLTPERARHASLRAFGDWQQTEGSRRKAALPAPDSRPPPENGSGNTEEGRNGPAPYTFHPAPSSVTGDTTEPRIGIAFPAPAASDVTMACAAQLVVALLGESDGRGRFAVGALAGTDASARFTPRQDGSLFLITARLPAPDGSRRAAGRAVASTADTPTVATLESALRDVLRSLQANPPSRSELAAARLRVQGHAQFDTETNAGLARALGYADIVGGDTPEQFRERVLQLTPADLQRFLQRYLDLSHSLTVRRLPAPSAPEAAP